MVYVGRMCLITLTSHIETLNLPLPAASLTILLKTEAATFFRDRWKLKL